MGKMDDIQCELKRRIGNGKYVPGVRLPSESVLADELGVNRITLNKAVNRLIADGWLVRGSSSRDGTYVRRRNTAFSQGVIGLLMRCDNSYSYALMHGIVDGTSSNNYLLALASPSPEELPIVLHKMMESDVRGVIVSGYGALKPSATAVPIVYADCVVAGDDTYTVSSDMYAGGRELAAALLEAGHRRIAFCLNSSLAVQENPRCAGFLAKLREWKIPNAEKCFYYTNHKNNRQILAQVFRTVPAPTAIVGENDGLALSLAMTLKLTEPGRSEAITFTGFGNLRSIQEITPFATVDQHPYELGSEACTMLIDVIKGDSVESAHSRVIAATLVNRHMIVPPPGK
jgi:DNA-binding LacI/PurR family transcriptional regulator